jgi:hypothetical protein
MKNEKRGHQHQQQQHHHQKHQQQQQYQPTTNLNFRVPYFGCEDKKIFIFSH